MGFESMIYLKAGDSQISNAGPSEVPSRLLKEHAEGNIVLSMSRGTVMTEVHISTGALAATEE